MATGFGVPGDASGNGTTPEDIQRINAAEYYGSGIIDGADVKGTAGLNYTVSAGAVLMNSGTDMAVKVPIPATTVPTVAGPASGTRTDTIYVVQNFPGTNGNSLVQILRTTGTPPAGAVILDKMNVPTGVTNTNTTTSVWDRIYAIPVGSSLGRLFKFTDTANGTLGNTGTPLTLGSGRFFLPTDRLVRFDLGVTVSGGGAALTGIYRWQIFRDNVLWTTIHWDYAGNFPTTQQISLRTGMTEGVHTVHYVQSHMAGSRWMHHYGGTEKYLGNTFEVSDEGVLK